MGGKIRRYHIGPGSIEAGDLVSDTIKHEVAIPIVVDKQNVTTTTLTTLDGWMRWIVGNWIPALVNGIYVELEYATAGAGDIDLHNITDGVKLADLVAPAAATAHTVVRIDVTSQVLGLTADKTLGIQAAGDGTNAATVYSAKLIVAIGIS